MIRGSLRVLGLPTVLILTALFLIGCASNKRKPTEAQVQFAAGQEEAFAMLTRNGIYVVRVVGPFKRPVLPWHEGLTLTQVILEAGYMEQRDPAQIIIQRGPAAEPVDPSSLLGGEDVPVQAGDVIHVLP